MESRSFKSRFICGMVSGVMALTGAVSILPVLTSEQNAITVFANNGGGSGGSHGDGSGAGSGTTTKGEFWNTGGSPLGVRIYLAPRDLVLQDKSGNVVTGNLTQNAIKDNLHTYVRYVY